MAVDTFLSRWSRRKALVREGIEVPPAPPLEVVPPQPAAGVAVPAPLPMPAPTPAPGAAEAPPAPTLDEVAALNRDSDYARFVARDVAPDVKNAALKKLFGDPHFNVMDGLDVYIDDYGKPDPLPAGVLRQMVQAQALRLFASEERAGAPEAATTPASLEAPVHEDPDLRLQPHDAAGRAGPEPGPGEDAGREH